MSFTPMFDELFWVTFCRDKKGYTEEKIQEGIYTQRNLKLIEHLKAFRRIYLRQPVDLRPVFLKVTKDKVPGVVGDENLWASGIHGKSWEELTGIEITDKMFHDTFAAEHDPLTIVTCETLALMEEIYVDVDKSTVASVMLTYLVHARKGAWSARIKKLKGSIKKLRHDAAEFQVVSQIPKTDGTMDYRPWSAFRGVLNTEGVTYEVKYNKIVELSVLFVQTHDRIFEKATRTCLGLVNYIQHNQQLENFISK